MPHPLLLARPTDPFLRLRVEDPEAVEIYVIDGDHVAFCRPGRRSGERWVTALGDDPERIAALIGRLRPHGIDGVHVHDHVYAQLPDDLQGPDPGHWSLWECAPDRGECAFPDRSGGDSESGIAHSVGITALTAGDPRIDDLLTHSDSAYIRADDPDVVEWIGIVERGELSAVGARMPGPRGTAHLVSICTHPQRRGAGLARQITEGLTARAWAEGATGVWLEMYAGNTAAARVYQSVGFTEVARYRSALVSA